MAGLDQSAREPSLPFFIDWAPETPYPGDSPALRVVRIEELRLDGDPDRIAHWLGGAKFPISVREGVPAIRSVVLGSDADQVVLDASLWA
jgi:hypothetical protein